MPAETFYCPHCNRHTKKSTQAYLIGESMAVGGTFVPVTLRPGIAKLGEQVTYRAQVIAVGAVRWLPPEPDSSFTWGSRRDGRQLGRPPARRYGKDAHTPGQAATYMTPDTSWVELPLQVFEPGIVPIPGLRFQLVLEQNLSPAGAPVRQMPTVSLIVVSTLTAADSAKGLKDVHGPLPAPWWERVPWAWVLGGLALVALAIVTAWWWRRRRRKPVPVAVPATVRRDPMAEALAELRALRGMHLPEDGRFGEHAFRLGQILRRYLEATVRLAMPGDTTPELVAHLRGGGLANENVQRLTALLRLWDRVKFAREPLTVEEAQRTEGAVEAYVRAREPAAAAPAAEPGKVA